MLSTRALDSTALCGQLGPVLTTETSAGPRRPCSRKNGPPESYGHGVVSRCGAAPVTPVTESPTDTTVIRPVRRCVTGAGFTLVVEPYPVTRRVAPTAGAEPAMRIGRMSRIVVSIFAMA